MVGDYYLKQSYDLIVLNVRCPSLQADELMSEIHAQTQAQTLYYSGAAETFEQDLRSLVKMNDSTSFQSNTN